MKTLVCLVLLIAVLVFVGGLTMRGQEEDPHAGQPVTCHSNPSKPSTHEAAMCGHCEKSCGREEANKCKVYCRKSACACERNCNT